MKLLFFGDVVGRPGRQAVAEALPKWQEQYKPDLIIANPENSAHGSGATPGTLDELQKAGVEAFTFGDHIHFTDWGKLTDYPIVGPANFSESAKSGAKVFETALGKRVLVINLLGSVFLKRPGTDYFKVVDEILKKHEPEKLDATFVDFHAEATSEKLTFADYLDGRVSAVVGTHTHVPTADTRVLPGGTAFQADVGMCGVQNSSIGVSFTSARHSLEAELAGAARKPKRTQADNPPYTCDAVLIDVIDRHKSRSIKRLTTRE